MEAESRSRHEDLMMEVADKNIATEKQNLEITHDQIDMLEKLSKIPELRVKNQHKSESDLSNEDKLDILKALFVSRPLQFLTQFGKYLNVDQLKHFDQFKQEESIGVYLRNLEQNLSSDTKRIRAKNRRYVALQKLVDTSDYFTEEEMQRRNPILYDQRIGKFHTKEEREGFLKRSCQAADSSTTPLTDLLLAHMDRNEEGESYRRLDQEQQKADEDAADAEYCDDEEEDEEMEVGNNRGGMKQPCEDENTEELDDDEKEILKEEFFTTMYQHFLEGKDADFDYSTVDNNEEYDIGENLELDEEEKYFDQEEPCEVNSDSNNSAIDDLFRPPVRCSEIESKIKVLTVQNDQSTLSEKTLTAVDQEDQTRNNDEDEDDLDVYMRSIERELQNQ